MKLLSLLNEELAYETHKTTGYEDSKQEITRIFYVVDGKKKVSPIEIVFSTKENENDWVMIIKNKEKAYGDRYKEGDNAERRDYFLKFCAYLLSTFSNPYETNLNVKNILEDLDEFFSYLNDERIIPEEINKIIQNDIKKVRHFFVDSMTETHVNRKEAKIEILKKAIENIRKEVSNFDYSQVKNKTALGGDERGFIRISLKLINDKLSEHKDTKIYFSPSTEKLRNVYLKVLKRFKYKVDYLWGHTYTITKGENT